MQMMSVKQDQDHIAAAQLTNVHMIKKNIDKKSHVKIKIKIKKK